MPQGISPHAEPIIPRGRGDHRSNSAYMAELEGDIKERALTTDSESECPKCSGLLRVSAEAKWCYQCGWRYDYDRPTIIDDAVTGSGRRRGFIDYPYGGKIKSYKDTLLQVIIKQAGGGYVKWSYVCPLIYEWGGKRRCARPAERHRAREGKAEGQLFLKCGIGHEVVLVDRNEWFTWKEVS